MNATQIEPPPVAVAVVDDLAEDRKLAALWLRRYWRERRRPDALHIFLFSSGDAFLQALGSARFALVLLDCRMEGRDGLETARVLRGCDDEAAVIFLTSSRDYAVDGYQVAACGYLVKPFSYPAFSQTLDHACRRLSHRQARLAVPCAETPFVFINDVVYCDVDKHYVQLHQRGGRLIRVRMTFAVLMRQLSAYPQFLCCYRGCAVNMDHIYKMEELNFLMDTRERVPFRKKEKTRLSRLYSAYLFSDARENLS